MTKATRTRTRSKAVAARSIHDPTVLISVAHYTMDGCGEIGYEVAAAALQLPPEQFRPAVAHFVAHMAEARQPWILLNLLQELDAHAPRSLLQLLHPTDFAAVLAMPTLGTNVHERTILFLQHVGTPAPEG